MNKKKILILSFIFVGIIILIILMCRKDTYTINIELIDDFSPDRKLIVYQNDEKINFREIQYTDGTYLCSGSNPTVSYSEIIGVKELIIKIDKEKQIIAKTVEK